MNYFIVAALILLVLSIIGIVVLLYILIKKLNEYNKSIMADIESSRRATPLNLSFTECDEIISYIMNDIWVNKYFINYRLREIKVIPKMDQEITFYVKDVLNAISKNVEIEILKYYSYDHFVSTITRKAQMLYIEYTNNNKPNTK